MKTKPVVISVTREHIKRGVQASANGCPIALAITDAMPLLEQTCIATGHANLFPVFRGSDVFHIAKLPKKVARFYHLFDLFGRGLTAQIIGVRPFRFTLCVPEYFLPSEPQRPSGQGRGALTVQSPVDELQPK